MKHKISGPAAFMYCVIAVSLTVCAICFGLYYGKVYPNKAILWTGVVAFMIMYHLWVRIIMGNVSKLFNIRYSQAWFRQLPFEEKLYSFLKVKKWKDKALTYNPELFSLKDYSLEAVANTMAKAETDHWINELISLFSIPFALIWGQPWVFAVSAAAAMVFDGQFIVIQRYNRPRILRIMSKKSRKEYSHL